MRWAVSPATRGDELRVRETGGFTALPQHTALPRQVGIELAQPRALVPPRLDLVPPLRGLLAERVQLACCTEIRSMSFDARTGSLLDRNRKNP